MKTQISIASDYAVLEAGQFEFYYGYEWKRDDDEGEIWGFRAKKNGRTILEYPVAKDRFEVTERLLEGIGKYFEGLP